MSEPISKPEPENPEEKLKIYFLPNLLTAGNLFCGFVALTKIVEADPNSFEYFGQIKLALAFILLADLISFGVAPAFLVQRVVLRDAFSDYPELNQVSWFIASIYLLCGAFRLARFNCLAAMPNSGANKDFLGFPIPSAAGLVASLTLLIIHFNEKEKSLGHWNYLIAVVLIFLSAMMVSEVKYPSFKSLGLRSTTTFLKLIVVVLFAGCLFILREKILYYVLPLFFTGYLVYGFIRPHISRAWRREIEEDDDEPGNAS